MRWPSTADYPTAVMVFRPGWELGQLLGYWAGPDFTLGQFVTCTVNLSRSSRNSGLDVNRSRLVTVSTPHLMDFERCSVIKPPLPGGGGPLCVTARRMSVRLSVCRVSRVAMTSSPRSCIGIFVAGPYALSQCKAEGLVHLMLEIKV